VSQRGRAAHHPGGLREQFFRDLSALLSTLAASLCLNRLESGESPFAKAVRLWGVVVVNIVSRKSFKVPGTETFRPALYIQPAPCHYSAHNRFSKANRRNAFSVGPR